jgi:hypothetical protein
MTDLCLERLAKIGLNSRADCDVALSADTTLHAGKQFALHWIGLNFRREQGDGFFYNLFKTDQVYEILGLVGGHVTFYDLTSGEPYRFHPGRIYYSSQNWLVWDALHLAKLECPLKYGRPYFCPGSRVGASKLCTFHGEPDNQRVPGLTSKQECILDLFDKPGLFRNGPPA